MRSVFGFVAALALAAGCKVSKSDSAIAVQQAQASIDRYDPARDLGPLFKDVELAGIFEDSKTFVDARPRFAPTAISKLFAGEHTAGAFDLRAFVDQNFEIPRPVGRDFQTDTVPIDLNSLMYNAERMIAALRSFRKQPGDSAVAARFNRDAERRRQSLLTAAYEPEDGYFYDVRWRTWQRVTDRPTLAAASVLFFGLALPHQAVGVASRLEHEFIKPGGFVTTNIRTGQQWDSPNGWPPLEWMAIEGLRRYGGVELANKARDRWLALNRRTYRASGRMMEKYDVVDLSRPAGGGEYGLQDGFGWTNGVALALSAEQRADRRAAPGTTERRRSGATIRDRSSMRPETTSRR